MPKPKLPVHPNKFQTTLPTPAYWLSAIIFLAGLFRIYNLDAIALWHNEGVTAALARVPWIEAYQGLIAGPVAPLYYLLQKLWSTMFGLGLTSLRFLPLLLGLLSVYITFRLVGELLMEKSEENPSKNEKLAALTALLVGLSPLQIQYSQTAQPYALAILLALCSTWLLSRLIRTAKFSDSILYALSVAAGLYTHEALLTIILAQVIFALYLLRKKPTEVLPGAGFRALMSVVLGLILALPQLIQSAPLVEQYSLGFTGFWESAEMTWRTLFGGTGTHRVVVSIGILAIFSAVVYFIRSTKTPYKWLLLASWFIPFLTSLLLKKNTDLDLPTTLVVSSVFLITIMAAAIFAAPSFRMRRALIIGFAVFSVFIFFKNWSDLDVKNLFFDRFENRKPGMVSIMKFINDTARNEDKIFAGSPYVLFSADYYNQTPIQPLLYAPSEQSAFLGQQLALPRTVADFSTAQKNDTAWVIWSRGFGGSKPVVPGNWEIIAEKYYMDTPALKGLIVVSEYHVD